MPDAGLWDAAGHLTFKAMACQIWNNNVSQGPLTANTNTNVLLGTISADSSGGTMPNVATNQIKVASGGWVVAYGWVAFTTGQSGTVWLTGFNQWSMSPMTGAVVGTAFACGNMAVNQMIGLMVSTTTASTISQAGLCVIVAGGL
jgi:hypothetical protein